MLDSGDQHPLKAFLCHATSDNADVEALYKRLNDAGVDAWFDEAKLFGGQDKEREIRKAVKQSDVFIVCLSNQFLCEGDWYRHLRLALKIADSKSPGAIYIIPTRLEECKILEDLEELYCVDLFGTGGGYEKLLQSLNVKCNELGRANLKIIPTVEPKRGLPKKPKKGGRVQINNFYFILKDEVDLETLQSDIKRLYVTEAS